ncbi:phage tail protein [Xanthomarina sp.]|uniref:phage tail protein n=1 Tax=Xanthomarina sp. TaxID=1931211 RepID=UPI002C898CBC|nr:tail fiber protein [Xanthomarina sp.]HLV38736.1 tail fiber protein [Xanthomarina sp.]
MKKTITILFLLLCLSVSHLASAQDPYVGEIRMFAGSYAPSGWAKCEGQLLAISQNSVLFAIIGTAYGGNGQTTFALPDLRGRVPMHSGNGPGLPSYGHGQAGGDSNVSLTVANLPAHSHQVNAVLNEGDSSSPESNFPANTKLLDKEYASVGTPTTMNSGMIGSTGYNQPFSIVQPYQTVTFIIALQGVFPSQN